MNVYITPLGSLASCEAPKLCPTSCANVTLVSMLLLVTAYADFGAQQNADV